MTPSAPVSTSEQPDRADRIRTAASVRIRDRLGRGLGTARPGMWTYGFPARGKYRTGAVTIAALVPAHDGARVSARMVEDGPATSPTVWVGLVPGSSWASGRNGPPSW